MFYLPYLYMGKAHIKISYSSMRENEVILIDFNSCLQANYLAVNITNRTPHTLVSGKTLSM